MSQGPVKKHACHRCGRKFARREHVERHERSHTKEQPFSCNVCQQAFTRKDLLSRHRRLNDHQPHEGGSEQRPERQEDVALEIPPLLSTDPTVPPSTSGSISIANNNGHIRPDDGASLNCTAQCSLPGQDREPDMFQSLVWDDVAFTDSFTLPFFPYSPSDQRLPQLPVDIFGPAVQENSAVNHTDSLSRFGSRLPSLEPENAPPKRLRIASSSSNSIAHPRMSANCLENVKIQLEPFSHLIDRDFALPTRHAFNRFIHGYFSGFHGHYPMFHVPTLSFEVLPIELLLSIAAVGAQYCLERSTGFKLFYAANAIAHERLRQKNLTRRQHVELRYINPSSESSSRLHAVHTFILMIAVSMWSETDPPFHEALSIRSTLERLIQHELPEQTNSIASDDWRNWIFDESIIRAKIIGFCFFNLQTIVFDVPPMVLINGMDLRMPCSETEWEASTSEHWRELHSSHSEDPGFKRSFHDLFADQIGGGNETAIAFPPLGSHGLIHGLIQRIWLLHQAADLPTQELPQSHVLQIEKALKRWRVGWESHEEASATPLHGHGPMSFTSAALLRLAYIRINMEAGTVPRCLSSWDPERVARDFNSMPPIRRSARATRAALHCAHGLSVIVKFGIEVFARTQIFFLSNQYALCSLESALFLTKWLEGVTGSNHETVLAVEETQLMDFIMDCIAETEYAADPKSLIASEKQLGAIITRLWAKIFRSDSIWEIVGLIGRSLEAYADLMEKAV